MPSRFELKSPKTIMTVVVAFCFVAVILVEADV